MSIQKCAGCVYEPEEWSEIHYGPKWSYKEGLCKKENVLVRIYINVPIDICSDYKQKDVEELNNEILELCKKAYKKPIVSTGSGLRCFFCDKYQTDDGLLRDRHYSDCDFLKYKKKKKKYK